MERKARRTLVGVVVSEKMEKTVTVEVKTEKKHALYGKKVVSSKKYKVHDENGVAHLGDKVLFMECRPLSATKHHRLVEVLEKGGIVA